MTSAPEHQVTSIVRSPECESLKHSSRIERSALALPPQLIGLLYTVPIIVTRAHTVLCYNMRPTSFGSWY